VYKDVAYVMKRNKVVLFIISLVFILLFSACTSKPVEWNGQIEYFENLILEDNIELDIYAYVGAMDYVWVGTVEEVTSNVLTGKGNDGFFSYYQINTVKNIKGKLA
jgi:hypothetical protein